MNIDKKFCNIDEPFCHHKTFSNLPLDMGWVRTNGEVAYFTNVPIKNAGYKSIDNVVGIKYYDYKSELSQLHESFRENDLNVIETKTKSQNIVVSDNLEQTRKIFLTETTLWQYNNNIKGIVFIGIDITNSILNKQIITLLSVLKHYTNKKTIFLNIKENIENNYHISKREYQCLFLALQGKTAKETAKILNISPRTVEIHIQKVKDKLQCKNKLQLIEFAVSNNILYKVPQELLVGLS